MPEYLNHNQFTVHLVGPDGLIIQIKSKQKKVLPEYFNKYCARGFIKLSDTPPATQNKAIINKIIKDPSRFRSIPSKIIS